jgi:hypothetical protein
LGIWVSIYLLAAEERFLEWLAGDDPIGYKNPPDFDLRIPEREFEKLF